MKAKYLAGERKFHRATLLILLLAFLAAVLTSVIHVLEAAPRTMDLVIPPVLAAGFLVLLVYLARRPADSRRVLKIAFIFPVTGLAVPSWYYSYEAAIDPDLLLTEILPPVMPMLFPVVVGLVLFLRPREVFYTACATWFLIAAPVLTYLAIFPAEIITPRGKELLLALGPVMAVMLVLLYFYMDIRRHVMNLQVESSNLRVLAEHDALTGLLNRRVGEDILRQLTTLKGKTDVAAIQFDIDHFKRVNDSFGHLVGDEVIREIVRRCQLRMRRGDFFIRWGGEEFLILIQGANAQDAGIQLRQAITGEPVGDVGTVTVSFGVTQLRPNDSPASFLKRGDEALYAAKHGGRNQVIIK